MALQRLARQPGAPATRIPAMQAGTYDFLTAVVTITPERAEQMLFMEGFVDADYRFLTKASEPDVTEATYEGSDDAGVLDGVLRSAAGTGWT